MNDNKEQAITLPLMVARSLVVFPGASEEVEVGRELSRLAVAQARELAYGVGDNRDSAPLIYTAVNYVRHYVRRSVLLDITAGYPVACMLFSTKLNLSHLSRLQALC